MAMDAFLYAQYRQGGGKTEFARWESSADVENWEQAPAPAEVGRRLYEGVLQRELPNSRAALVNNLTHWAFGIANGAAYGVVAGSVPKPRVWYGAPFGASVWGGGYVVLPAAGLYRPIWQYSPKVLAKDLSAHLVYGLTTAAAFKVVSLGRRSRR